MDESSGFPKTLVEAIRHFSDPAVCREFVALMRWPDGIHCPREGCGSEKIAFIESRGLWRCNGCKKQFSVKVGTIFEDSPIGLDKWLPAVWLVTNSRNGISSYEMARSLSVTQKTAWFMDHRIRLAMKTESFLRPLEGEVEADETFIGGRESNKHKGKKLNRGRGSVGKTVVMGMLERDGELRTRVIPRTTRKELHGAIRENVAPGSAVYTDALPSYRRMGPDYLHAFVDHTVEYVDGRVHTNGLESFWGQLKRSLSGTHHSIDPVHLDRYLDEFTHRHNTRKLNDAGRFVKTVRQIVGRRLTYKELTGKATA